MENILHVGLDVGSTTVKIVVIDSNKKEIYSDYTRHFSDTKNTVCKVLESFLQFFAVQNSIPRNRFPYTELCRAWPFRTAESGICDSRAAI